MSRLVLKQQKKKKRIRGGKVLIMLTLILFFIICVMFTEGGNDIAFGRYFQYMLWLGANKTHKRGRSPAGEWVTH